MNQCIRIVDFPTIPTNWLYCAKGMGLTKGPRRWVSSAHFSSPPVVSASNADDCDDDDNDVCDLYKRDEISCTAHPLCTWCISSGLVPAMPDCVLATDAPWIPKQIYSCAAKDKVTNAARTVDRQA